MASGGKSALVETVADIVVEISGWEDHIGMVYRLGTTRMSYLMQLKRTLRRHDPLSELVATYISQGAPEEQIREVLHFAPKLAISDCAKAAGLAFGLSSYPHLKSVQDVTTLDEVAEAECIALMKVTHAIDIETAFTFPTSNVDFHRVTTRGNLLIGMPYKFGGKSQRLRDHDMTSLILQHVDEVDRIVSLISHDNILEARVIRAALEGIELPLAEGSL